MKPGLLTTDVLEAIEGVQASDLEEARRMIAAGIEEAQQKWIEAPTLARALALELVNVAAHSQTRRQTASYLRTLADALEAKSDCH